MKKVLLSVLAMALLASLFAPATASASELSVLAAYWDTDQLGETAGLGLRTSWNFGQNSKLDLSAYYLQEFDETADINNVGDLVDALGGGVDVLPVDLGVRFGPGGLYVGGGVSYYFFDTPEGVDIDDEVGWYGIIGYEFGGERGGIRFFIEGQYRDIEGTAGSSFPEIRDQIVLDLSGPFVALGVTF